MKKNTRDKARGRTKKLRIQSTGKGLTSQAGLIPAVKFLDKREFLDALDTFIPYKRGNNAVYQLSDVMYTRRTQVFGFSIADDLEIFGNYLPPPYTIFGKGEENSSRNEVKTFWLRLRKVEMAAWIRA